MAYRKVTVKGNGKFRLTLEIFGLIFLGFITSGIGFIFIPFVIPRMVNVRRRNYRYTVSNVYHWHIRNALETEHPEGIIYILQNAINELNKFGITQFSSYKKQYSFSKSDSNRGTSESMSETRGVPNKTNLRNAIKLAQEISQEWKDIGRSGGVGAQIQKMEEIKNLFKEELIYLDWENWILKIKGGQPIYEFWYTDEDYYAVSKPKKQTATKASVNNPSRPSPRILSYEEFLQQHPELYLLSEGERRREYNKYLVSMGVQPQSPTNRPAYGNNSSDKTSNKKDDSVW
ncbi:MAG: hypothetical protein VKL42_06150 [Snowella sp.]|nr:hypothetical protein [Snowella sp.]